MTSRKFLDDPETCVDAMLAGLQATFPRLRLLPDARGVVFDGGAAVVAAPAATVGLVSGGGAGHEPFCAGYVGEGMLSGTVAGPVFASPPATHIAKTIKCVAQRHSGGVLLIVANYTGDCLNFGLAAEWAKKDAIHVRTVVVGEDCALLESHKENAVGRRGMCGLLFVYKIVGHMAASGASMETLVDTAKKLGASMATMGLATKSCTLPGSTTPLFSLETGTVELGLGVHGEAGTCTVKMSTASEHMTQVLGPIIQTLHLESGNKVAVLINNLGGFCQLEQWVVPGIVRRQLEDIGIVVARMYTGTLMTSLEMAGVQVCVLNLSSEEACLQTWLECLDAPTSAPAWPGCQLSIPGPANHVPFSAAPGDNFVETETLGLKLEPKWVEILEKVLEAASLAVIAQTDKLNELDSGCGDGDCGSTLARLSKGILLKLPALNLKYPAQLLLELADLSSSSMGGTSGAVYALLFSGASSELCCASQTDILQGLVKSWRKGLQTIMQYSVARQGDRSMLDALIPACEEFERISEESNNGLAALKAALEAAQAGCKSTATMSARVGRASYVNDARLSDVDAGAYGVVVWLESFYFTIFKCLELENQN